jgi:hypothetical protein
LGAAVRALASFLSAASSADLRIVRAEAGVDVHDRRPDKRADVARVQFERPCKEFARFHRKLGGDAAVEQRPALKHEVGGIRLLDARRASA